MLTCLLAVSLNLLTVANEPPQHGAAKVDSAHKPKAKEEGASKHSAKEEETPKAKGKAAAAPEAHGAEKAPAKAEAKPVRRKPASPAIPAEEPASDAPVVKHAVKPPAPRRPAPAHAAPAAPAGVNPDVRAARLEAENAKLRRQLALTGSVLPADIVDARTALDELMAGNQRFVDGARVRTLLSMQDSELRATLAKGQAPFAVIITCSDSRLADNLIFDQELGRLFTIREAGNAPDIQGLASVEYALEHLGSKIVVVLGHGSCGAVKAVNEAHGKPLPGNLWSLQAAMTGLLESTPEDPNETPAAHMDRLVEHNAQRQAQAVLDRSDIVRELVAKKRVKVVPAVYDLLSGKVTFLAAPSIAHEAPAHH